MRSLGGEMSWPESKTCSFSAPLDAVLEDIVRPHCCDKEGHQYGMSVFKVADSAESPTWLWGWSLVLTKNLPAPQKYLSAHFLFLHCFTRPSAHHLAYSFIHFQYLLFQLLPLFRASTLKENRSAHRYQVLSTWTSLNGSKSSTITSPLINHVVPLHSWC